MIYVNSDYNKKEMSKKSERKSANEEPTVDSYEEFTDIQHMLALPAGYIGSKEHIEEEDWLMYFTNEEEGTPKIDMIKLSTITLPRGLERLYLEVLSNASDNAYRSLQAGVDPYQIEVNMTDTRITIKNYGLTIPIELNEKGIYIPQMIFGRLRTSSNYSGDRHAVGINGIGAKAANIFSKEFKVVIENAKMGKKYIQTWKNNMSEVSEPTIIPFKGKRSSTEVSYVADFDYFGYPDLVYPDEAICLFARHAADISFTCKTKTIFSFGEDESMVYPFDFDNIVSYAELYFENTLENCITHYQWPNTVKDDQIVRKKTASGCFVQYCKDKKVFPEIELIALDTPDNSQYVSFVNCMMTRKGGAHLKAAIDGCFKSVVQNVNSTILEKKKGKKDELDKKDKANFGVNIKDLIPHISMILSCRLKNPKFGDHSKVDLISPTPKVVLNEKEIKPVGSWRLTDRLLAAAQAKQYASISKEERIMSKKRDKKHIAANFAKARNPERINCTLYIMEGDSAAAYSESYIKHMQNGRDYIGTFPIRGKGMNVMNKPAIKVAKNEEIKRLKSALNLVDDADYSNDDVYNTLNYGNGILIMADADVDGKHIIGLILNYFFVKFPALLARGYIKHYRTRIVNVSLGSESIKFYTKAKYEDWRRNTPNYKKWVHKYYKGLASSKDETIAEDFRNPRIVDITFDDETEEDSDSMFLAFHKNYSDQRKYWINQWKPSLEVEDSVSQSISQFINGELAEFSLANMQRSIPRIEDGLKESQRKIIATSTNRWNYKNHGSGGYSSVKVAQFGGNVSEKMQYEHGEKSLEEAIIGMAQNYVGTNNIPLFYNDGQFGTRAKGGKDAGSARYIHTYPRTITTYIFRDEDENLLIRKESEGEIVEPETYYPVVPMVLVNGAQGIGSGHSTFIPQYDPNVLVDYIRKRINIDNGIKETLPKLIPYYRGHRGELKVVENKKTQKIAKKEDLRSEASENSEEEIEKEPGHVEEGAPMPHVTMVSYGNYHINEAGDIVIDELPIGKWTHDYLETLDVLKEKKIIKDYRNLSAQNKVYFELYGFANGKPDHEKLFLKRTYGLTNMVLLNSENKPTKYSSPESIIEEFYQIRVEIYNMRKANLIDKLEKKMEKLKEILKFVHAILEDKIQYKNVPKDKIIEQLVELGINTELLSVVKFYDCTKEQIISINSQIAKIEEEINVIRNTPATDFWLEDLEEFEKEYSDFAYIESAANSGDHVDTKKKGRKVRASTTTAKKGTKTRGTRTKK